MLYGETYMGYRCMHCNGPHDTMACPELMVLSKEQLRPVLRYYKEGKRSLAAELVQLGLVHTERCIECSSIHHRVCTCPSLEDVHPEILEELEQSETDLLRLRDGLYSVIAYRHAAQKAGPQRLSERTIYALYTMYNENRGNEAEAFLRLAESSNEECAECHNRDHRVHDCPVLPAYEKGVFDRLRTAADKGDYYRLHTILWSLEDSKYRSRGGRSLRGTWK